MQVTRGFLAGALATIPMTAAFAVLGRILPRERRVWENDLDPLPPRKITEKLLAEAGLVEEAAEPGRLALITTVNHFAYGASVGAVYGVLAEKIPWLSRSSGGAAYGLAVWGFSYQKFLPALGLHPAASRDADQRNILMILSHLVWGISLAAAWRVYPSRPPPPAMLSMKG
jgi:uncharacterized membrane protein YagU involved in acid resistance